MLDAYVKTKSGNRVSIGVHSSFQFARKESVSIWTIPFIPVSTMVEFWKRFPPNAIAALLAASTPVEDQDDHNDQKGGSSGESKGTLIMDAICCPADISCPQVFQLLN